MYGSSQLSYIVLTIFDSITDKIISGNYVKTVSGKKKKNSPEKFTKKVTGKIYKKMSQEKICKYIYNRKMSPEKFSEKFHRKNLPENVTGKIYRKMSQEKFTEKSHRKYLQKKVTGKIVRTKES